MNDPDMYMNAATDGANAALRARPGGPLPAAAIISTPAAAPITNAPDPSAPTGVVVPPVATPDDPDTAPASAPPRPKSPASPPDTVNAGSSEGADEVSKAKGDISTTQSNGHSLEEEDKAHEVENGTAI